MLPWDPWDLFWYISTLETTNHRTVEAANPLVMAKLRSLTPACEYRHARVLCAVRAPHSEYYSSAVKLELELPINFSHAMIAHCYSQHPLLFFKRRRVALSHILYDQIMTGPTLIALQCLTASTTTVVITDLANIPVPNPSSYSSMGICGDLRSTLQTTTLVSQLGRSTGSGPLSPRLIDGLIHCVQCRW